MPLCGFNKDMLKGLSLFSLGLYKQALKRSKKDKITLEEAYRAEVKEMDSLLREINNKKRK